MYKYQNLSPTELLFIRQPNFNAELLLEILHLKDRFNLCFIIFHKCCCCFVQCSVQYVWSLIHQEVGQQNKTNQRGVISLVS